MSTRVKDVMTTRVVAVRKGARFKDIAALLTGDPGHGFFADPGRFAVTVSSGIVILEGRPETTARGREIAASAWHVEGVVSVRDRLTYPEER